MLKAINDKKDKNIRNKLNKILGILDCFLLQSVLQHLLVLQLQLYLQCLSVGQRILQVLQLLLPVQERKGKEDLQSIWMIQLIKCLQVLFKGKFIFQTEHEK